MRQASQSLRWSPPPSPTTCASTTSQPITRTSTAGGRSGSASSRPSGIGRRRSRRARTGANSPPVTYTEIDDFDDDLTFERRHVAFEGKVADVYATEHNHFGTVTLDGPAIYLNVRTEDYPADLVRAVAAKLVEAADLLERLLGAGA